MIKEEVERDFVTSWGVNRAGERGVGIVLREGVCEEKGIGEKTG